MPTTRTPDRTPLITYLKLQRDLDRQMLSLLKDAAGAINLELYALESASKIGGLVRREQYVAAKVAIHREMESMWLKMGDTIAAAREAAAAEAVAQAFPEAWMRAVLPDADVDMMLQSARAQAARGIETLQARLELSKVPLAESVYRNGTHANGVIDEIVNGGLAAGMSAAEIAKNVRAFINPNTSGGVKYASMRLGRTELNNAFHAQQVQEGIKTPWTLAMKWNLSGSHPVPDECNTYADDTHYAGGAAGVFLPEEVPGKPHPNCLCYTTPVTPDREEFIRQLQAGSYDDYLDEEFGLDPSSRFASAGASTPARSAARTGTRVDRTPELDPGFADLPKGSPTTYADDVVNVNPAGVNRRNYDHLTNCHFVVETAEMRARGYEVFARPTVDSTGRLQQVIDNGWRTPDGELRNMSIVWEGPAGNPRALLADFTADWPDGARGFVTGPWKNGGAHTFSVEKRNGKLYYTDAQIGDPDVEHYLDNMTHVGVLRVDDLVPQKQVLDSFTTEAITKSTEASQLEAAELLFHQYDAAYAQYIDRPPVLAVIDQQMVKLGKAIIERGGVRPKATLRNAARKAAGIA